MNEVALRANDVLRNDVMLRINDVALRANGFPPPFSPSGLENTPKCDIINPRIKIALLIPLQTDQIQMRYCDYEKIRFF
jgi:hypothetical protein